MYSVTNYFEIASVFLLGFVYPLLICFLALFPILCWIGKFHISICTIFVLHGKLWSWRLLLNSLLTAYLKVFSFFTQPGITVSMAGKFKSENYFHQNFVPLSPCFLITPGDEIHWLLNLYCLSAFLSVVSKLFLFQCSTFHSNVSSYTLISAPGKYLSFWGNMSKNFRHYLFWYYLSTIPSRCFSES